MVSNIVLSILTELYYIDSSMALPGRVIGIVEKMLAVDFCNGE